ncbi:unnamed protein product [Polarella glacialis]|uniref:FHA domain-containing protein n=1 Tax=Polarella glacialis TaxID=89957 RepID=A0A813EJ02_POLGL|nr:unnamed protein product [Polarella glacialis]
MAPSVSAFLVALTELSSDGVEVPAEGKLLFGRKESCAIRLVGPTVSAFQCAVAWSESTGSFELTDMSSNGTFLNGRILRKSQVTPLKHGDELQMTKRWQTDLALQFRFVIASIEAALQQSLAETQATASALEAELRSARRERERETIAFTASSADAALMPPPSVPPRGKMSSAGAASAAAPAATEEQELAVREAEQAQLTAHCVVLEGEVAEQKARLEQLRLDAEAAMAAAADAAEQTLALKEELNAREVDAAEEDGKSDAFRQQILECEQAKVDLLESPSLISQLSWAANRWRDPCSDLRLCCPEDCNSACVHMYCTPNAKTSAAILGWHAMTINTSLRQ